MEDEKLENEDNKFTIRDSEDVLATNLDTKLTLKAPPSNNMTFHGVINHVTGEQGQVGELNWDDGTMKFIGDAEESAQIFFNHVIRLACTCACQKCEARDEE